MQWKGIPVAAPLAHAEELMLAMGVGRNCCFTPNSGPGSKSLLPFSILTGETCQISTKVELLLLRVSAVSPSSSWLAPG